jgi:PAS domain S-box-containing protein
MVGEWLTKTATLIVLPEEQRRAQKISDDLNGSLSRQLRLTTMQVEQSEERFRRMAMSAPQGMYMFDKDGRPLHVNDKYLELVGERREDHEYAQPTKRKKNWHEHVHAEDLSRFLGAYQTLLDTRAPLTLEYRLKAPWKTIDPVTGQSVDREKWFRANAFPDVGPDGSLVAVMGKHMMEICSSIYAGALIGS